jgi:Tfp pilus assembly protein PilX
MRTSFIQIKQYKSDKGAALVTSLMLLTVLTLLSISVMSTSRLQMTMAGNVQVHANAFQLAETANDAFIAGAINRAACINDQNPGNCNVVDLRVDAMKGSRSTENRFVEYIEKCPVVSGSANSWNAMAAFHFVAESNGTTDVRGGTASTTQGWYVCRAN